jgi:FtsH-binding integral membrane protein
MEDFENLKKLWQQESPTPPKIDVSALKKSTQSNQRHLERSQLKAIITLTLTALFIFWLGFFSSLQFRSRLTYAAMIMIIVVCLAQVAVCISIYRRLRRFNVAAPATEHLQQWENYYRFRQKQIKINTPLYSLALGIGLAGYYLEILRYFSLFYQILIWAVTLAWILFAHFVLGRRTIRKEYQRLEEIIDNLRKLQQQLH